MVRVNDRAELIVRSQSLCKRFTVRAIHGGLMLSTQGDDIDQMVTAERLRFFLRSRGRFPRSIVRHCCWRAPSPWPGRRLADSAERVRRRNPHPRRDSHFNTKPAPRRDRASFRPLRDMTDALYNRKSRRS